MCDITKVVICDITNIVMGEVTRVVMPVKLLCATSQVFL
jgi:hypothetical protein